DYDTPLGPGIYPAGWGSTDASGAYTMGGLPIGDYKVQFNDCGDPAMYVGEWYNDQPDFESADLVPVTAGVNTSGIDAALVNAATGDCPNPDAWPWQVPANDPDCDGFPSTVPVGIRGAETTIGTDPLDPCADTPDPNDEADDRWPPDWDDSQTVDLLDVLSFKPHYGATDPSDPKYDARYDLNTDGAINILDLLPFKPFFRLTCA
ncbi:unnamed protein product, partial [marine sediment metagenome]